MSGASWAGKTADEILADVQAVLESLPPQEPLELSVPLNVFNYMTAEGEDRIDRAFRRKERWANSLMLDRIAQRAASEMFAYSRGPQL